jgi:DMSO/TMAO reductase YedYZ molybdopterin-dependent catalytic subunit
MVDHDIKPPILPTPPSPPPARGSSSGRHAVAGVVAVGAALAVSELIDGIFFSAPSLIVALGDATIDLTPEPISKWAIRTFGTNDKLVLVLSILGVAAIAGALLGRAGRKNPAVPVVGFSAFGLLAAVAGLQVPLASSLLVVVSVVASILAGLTAYRLMARTIEEDSPDPSDYRASRRAFLAASGAVAVASVAGVSFGRALSNRARVAAASRGDIVLPRPSPVLPSPTAAQSLDSLNGISTLVTSNRDFYRIDTALSVPMVDLDTWKVDITGDVGRPYSFGYPELLALPMEEHYVTIACVSNQVGGDLIGTAKWLGVPLHSILEEADVPRQGKQVVARSVDGFTVGFPVEAVFDGREALLAIGMNDEPLPFEHGFPARLVVSGLYGYVSATKWLSEIQIVDWDAFDAYWIPRGWDKQAPIKTQSRIDTPRRGEVAAGPRTIAGVAWAQNRGISRVEVNVDETGWQEATLPEELSIDTWRQWAIDVDLAPGAHVIQVRATDGTGATQSAEVTSPRPNGAQGYHTVQVSAVDSTS